MKQRTATMTFDTETAVSQRPAGEKTDMPLKLRFKRWTTLFILVTIALMASGCSGQKQESKPVAKDGVLDLTQWNWGRDPMLKLNGEWQFEWLTDTGVTSGETLPVPGVWGSTPAGTGGSFPGQGAGVYRLTIIHGTYPDSMAIRVPNIATAYEMKIDGKTVISRGRFGTDPSHTIPYQTPGTVYFTDSDNRMRIEIKVANFDHRSGGIRTALVMGKADRIERLQMAQASKQLIVIGCLLMMGFYHAGLFVLRRKETGNLFFAMLCLFIGLRTGLIGECFVVGWLPWINWTWATKLDYLSFVLAAWSGFAYYQRIYPREIRRWWELAAGAAAIVLCGVIIVFPPVRFTSWILYDQAYLLTVCIITIAALFLSFVRRREGAWLALIGMAGLVTAVVNDILLYNGWRASIELVSFGLLFLIIMNSFIMALRFSRTFERAEHLSAELKLWNDRLEEKIEERTEELRKSNETLEVANSGLENMESARRQLFSNISHDLRTPITLLQGYLEALHDGVITEEEHRRSTIRLMLGKVQGLNGLIHDLFELSILEAGRVELSLETVTLEEWTTKVQDQYAMDMRDRSIIYSCVLADDEAGSTRVSVDLHRMDRVFENLLFNAVRYTPEGGKIGVRFGRRLETGEIEITVEDSGCGIDPADLLHIFDGFYKKDKSRHSSSGGSGLGLAISREIVELHGGTISAYNRAEGGGGFCILLPAGQVTGSRM